MTEGERERERGRDREQRHGWTPRQRGEHSDLILWEETEISVAKAGWG